MIRPSFFALLLCAFPWTLHAEGKLRLFILAGQGNMTIDETKEALPRFREAFPDDRVIVVGHTAKRCALNYWYKDWRFPDGIKIPKYLPTKRGTQYDALLTKTKQALRGEQPDTVTLLWMQGEEDGTEGYYSLVYETSLRGLFQQFRDDLKCPEMRVVLGRIHDARVGNADWNRVRQAQVSVAESDRLVRWFDTDDLNGDDDSSYYHRKGQLELRRRFLDKAIEIQDVK